MGATNAAKRAISFVLAGLVIVAPMWVLFYGDDSRITARIIMGPSDLQRGWDRVGSMTIITREAPEAPRVSRPRLVQRFAMLAQVEPFILVLLAHPQWDQGPDHLEEDVGHHPGP